MQAVEPDVDRDEVQVGLQAGGVPVYEKGGGEGDGGGAEGG